MAIESFEGRQRGILGAIERVGNRLPDPVFLRLPDNRPHRYFSHFCVAWRLGSPSCAAR